MMWLLVAGLGLGMQIKFPDPVLVVEVYGIGKGWQIDVTGCYVIWKKVAEMSSGMNS